jgi:hypothetical protein
MCEEPLTLEQFDWKKLQNGSDIRGVALEGVANESVNLTPQVVNILGKLCEMAETKSRETGLGFNNFVGRDSRLSGRVMQGVMDGIVLSVAVFMILRWRPPCMFVSTSLQD